jgi:hypothetical protein
VVCDMKLQHLVLWVALGCALTASAQSPGMRGMRVRSAEAAGIPNYDVEQCHALVIGINEYKHWSSLRSAANDAQAVSDLLKSHFGYKNVTLLQNEQATRRNILSALDGYTRLTEQDSLLIYYAGHGWMDDYQNGFWVPHEAPRDSKFDYVANSRIVNDYFKKYKVRHLLVIADSCFSGALMRGGDHGRDNKWKLPSGFRKPSRWVLTSGDLAPVPDDAGGGHSPFATRFLQFMKYSDEPAFGIRDLHLYVRKNLKTEPLCEPISSSMHMPGGEYVFCRMDTPLPHGMADDRPVIHSTPTVTLPPAQPVVQYGALVVNSPTEGVVSIDGQGAYLITPTQNLRWGKLPIGTHNIAVVAGSQRWETRVQVVAGQTVTVSAVLDSEQERLAEAIAAREARALAAEQARQAEEERLRQQRLYELEQERKRQETLQRQQLDDARARRALEIKLQREAEEREKAAKKKVRRPKVH